MWNTDLADVRTMYKITQTASVHLQVTSICLFVFFSNNIVRHGNHSMSLCKLEHSYFFKGGEGGGRSLKLKISSLSPLLIIRKL